MLNSNTVWRRVQSVELEVSDGIALDPEISQPFLQYLHLFLHDDFLPHHESLLLLGECREGLVVLYEVRKLDPAVLVILMFFNQSFYEIFHAYIIKGK